MKALRICIDTPDVDRALAFYRDAFGLVAGRRLGRHWIEMRDPDGVRVMFDLLGTREGSNATPSRPDVRRDFGRHWTAVHLDIEVDDIEASVARAVAAGATLDRPIQERPYGRMANMADPFGHGFCLLQMNARGYDALVDSPEED